MINFIKSKISKNFRPGIRIITTDSFENYIITIKGLQIHTCKKKVVVEYINVLMKELNDGL